jgi:pimeloyl-ACP methyl ester carboxylesterase
MKRMHIHVAVADLAQSVSFYEQLFGAEPTVLKPDYAKWMLDDPRVNFAISARGIVPGVDHLGIQGNGIAAAGHSFGGAVAAYLAAQDGRIGKLILIDTAAAAPLDWSFASMCRLMILQRLIDGGRYGKLGLSFKLIGSVAMNFLRNGVYAPATQATMRRLLTRTDGVFSQIKTPTLILWGEQDKVFPFAAAEVVESQLNDGKVEAIDGNHEWCLYQPRLAAEKISAWVG